MKERMDIILKVNLKLQTCQQSLQAIHLVHGNSVERQRMKEEMEARFIDVDKLLDHLVDFNKTTIFSGFPIHLGRTPPHLSKVND